MVSRALPGIGLEGFWNLGEDGWKTGMDANLRKLSALVQTRVIGRVAAVPGSPNNGDIYVVTAGADANKVAIRDNGAWVYLTPFAGWRVWDSTFGYYINFNGTIWVEEEVAAGSGFEPKYQAAIASAAVLDITSQFIAGNNYRIRLNAARPTVASDLYARLSSDNGGSFIAGSNYRRVLYYNDDSDSAIGLSPSQGDSGVRLGANSVGTTSDVQLELFLCNPAASNRTQMEWSMTFRGSAGRAAKAWGSAHYETVGVHNAMRFYWGSGNFAANGTIQVFEEPII